ncbi:MAG: DUF4386 domain-containing protein [Bacteroidota bacterium]
MKSTKQIGHMAGVLFLIQFAMGILVKQILLGPGTFDTNFLVDILGNATQLKISVLLDLLVAVLSVVIAVVLLPVFRQFNDGMALLYLSFCIMGFANAAIENNSILSLLAMGQEYFPETTHSSYKESLGGLVQERRIWAHYVNLLISALPLTVLYYVLYRLKLVPRLLSGWGLMSALIMFINVLWAFFGGGSMLLYAPLGLAQLSLSLWLVTKGFREPSPKKTITYKAPG